MAGVNAGDIFTVPVSHGEGRFVADDKALRKLIENGRWPPSTWTPTHGQRRHPVEPQRLCVRHRGHHQPRRPCAGQDGPLRAQGTDLYKNVPGEKDQLLFESGVKYFK